MLLICSAPGLVDGVDDNISHFLNVPLRLDVCLNLRCRPCLFDDLVAVVAKLRFTSSTAAAWPHVAFWRDRFDLGVAKVLMIFGVARKLAPFSQDRRSRH